MTKWAIWSAVLGTVGLSAQIPQSSENVGPDYGTAWSERKPRNGQCPVCGTQVPEWKDDSHSAQAHLLVGNGKRAVCCANCSAVFEQKEEEE